MKTTLITNAWTTAVCLFATSFALCAQGSKPIDRVTAKGGITLAIRGTDQSPIEKEIMFGGVKLMTNAVFKVGDGKLRPLKDGQVLIADGTLINVDGTLMPVIDHVIMQQGQIILVKDGEPVVLGGELVLGDGTRVLPDGTVVAPDGSRSKMLDGQIRTLTGGVIAAKDAVLLKNGQVFVQKDGSSLQVPPGRSIMMNNGTKVFGDGTVINPDGSRTTLAEGKLVTIEGVSVKR